MGQPVRFTRCRNDGLWVGRRLRDASAACPRCGAALHYPQAGMTWSLFGEAARNKAELAVRLAQRAHDALTIRAHNQVAYGAAIAEIGSEACDAAHLAARDRPGAAVATLLLGAVREACVHLGLPGGALDDDRGRPASAVVRARRALDLGEAPSEAADLESPEEPAFRPGDLFQAGLLTSAALTLKPLDLGGDEAARAIRAEVRAFVLSLIAAESSRRTAHFLLESGGWASPEEQALFRQILDTSTSDAHRGAALSALGTQLVGEEYGQYLEDAAASLGLLGRRLVVRRLPSFPDDLLALRVAIALLRVESGRPDRTLPTPVRVPVLDQVVKRTGRVFSRLVEGAARRESLPRSIPMETFLLLPGADPKDHVGAIRLGMLALSRLDGLYQRFVDPAAGLGLPAPAKMGEQVRSALRSDRFPNDVTLLEYHLKRVPTYVRVAMGLGAQATPLPAGAAGAAPTTPPRIRAAHDYPGRLMTAHVESLLAGTGGPDEGLDGIPNDKVDLLKEAIAHLRAGTASRHVVLWSLGSIATAQADRANAVAVRDRQPAFLLARQYWLHEAWHSAKEARSAGLSSASYQEHRNRAWLAGIHRRAHLTPVDWELDEYFAYSSTPQGSGLPVPEVDPEAPHIAVARHVGAALESSPPADSMRELRAAARSWGAGTRAAEVAEIITSAIQSAPKTRRRAWHRALVGALDQLEGILPHFLERGAAALGSLSCQGSEPSVWTVSAADLGELLSMIRRDPGIGRHWHGGEFLYSQGPRQPWTSFTLIAKMSSMIRQTPWAVGQGRPEHDLVAALRGALSAAILDRPRAPFEGFVREGFTCTEGELLSDLGLVDGPDATRYDVDVYCPRHVRRLLDRTDHASLMWHVRRAAGGARPAWGRIVRDTGRPVPRLGLWFVGSRRWSGARRGMDEIARSVAVTRHASARLWLTLDAVVQESAEGPPVCQRLFGAPDTPTPEGVIPEEAARALRDAGLDAVVYVYSFAMHDSFKLEEMFGSFAEIGA